MRKYLKRIVASISGEEWRDCWWATPDYWWTDGLISLTEERSEKEDLEKKLVDDNQQLEEYQQKWEKVIKEKKKQLSTEVSSLNDKICSNQDTEVQK